MSPLVATIDYDEIGQWAPILRRCLAELAGESFFEDLSRSNPKYIEDAGKWVCDRLGAESLASCLSINLATERVRVYHATRLTPESLDRLEDVGLQPLDLATRRVELERIFSAHPRWADVKQKMADVLEALGPRKEQGAREDGRIHVCFSRTALLKGCSHYLLYGGEVDTHIVHRLFDPVEPALSLLSAARSPYLVSLVVSFSEAVSAASPWKDTPKGELPSLLRALVQNWAFREAHPDFTIASQRDDIAGWFNRPFSRAELEAISPVSEADIRR